MEAVKFPTSTCSCDAVGSILEGFSNGREMCTDNMICRKSYDGIESLDGLLIEVVFCGQGIDGQIELAHLLIEVISCRQGTDS